MFTLTIGKKKYKIKFAYEPVTKERLISRVVGMKRIEEAENEEERISALEDVLAFIPEVLLVGLQKFHYEEFGYDYETHEGKKEQLHKVYEMIDTYSESSESGIMELYQKMEEEMVSDSFLSRIFQMEESKLKVVEEEN